MFQSYTMFPFFVALSLNTAYDALLVSKSYRFRPQHGYITRVKPVDTTNIKCTTCKPGAPLRIVLDGSRLHTAMKIHPFCKLINALEGVHNICHHLPQWI